MGPGVTPVYLHTRCCLSPSPDGAVAGLAVVGPAMGPGAADPPPSGSAAGGAGLRWGRAPSGERALGRVNAVLASVHLDGSASIHVRRRLPAPERVHLNPARRTGTPPGLPWGHVGAGPHLGPEPPAHRAAPCGGSSGGLGSPETQPYCHRGIAGRRPHAPPSVVHGRPLAGVHHRGGGLVPREDRD